MIIAEGTPEQVADAVATALRARGIPCEVAPAAAKFGKQIRFAERRGIPYVWFPGASDSGGDQVKDIRSGEQVDARVRAREQQRDGVVVPRVGAAPPRRRNPAPSLTVSGRHHRASCTSP